MKEIMLFQAGDGQFGLYLSSVRKVYRASELSECLPPEMADKCDTSEGIGDIKQIRSCRMPEGTETVLYDFPMIFGGKKQPTFLQKAILTDAGRVSLAVLADHIEGVSEADAERIIPLPRVFGEKSLQWFPSVLLPDIKEKENRLVPILEPLGMAGITRTEDMETLSGEPSVRLRQDAEEFISDCLGADALEKRMLRALRQGVIRGFHREMFQFILLRKSLQNKVSGH